jgi:hypothetical protein
VHFCAADRVVTSRNLNDLLGNFTRQRIQEDGLAYFYAGYVTSPELTEQVEAERDDFQIEERAADLFSNKMLSLEEIEAEVVERGHAQGHGHTVVYLRARDCEPSRPPLDRRSGMQSHSQRPPRRPGGRQPSRRTNYISRLRIQG